MYVYVLYVTEDCITHNLVGRGLDTLGYTILRNVFNYEQQKNRKKPGWGAWVLGFSEMHNFYYSAVNSNAMFARSSGEDS
jgi:hypothetical protein